MAKTTYMIVTGASVVVVRDGKRKSLPAGSGDDFTESEIATILKAVPGALRKPINEGGQSAEELEAAAPKKAKAKKAAPAAAPAKGKAKKAAPVADADDDDDDDDADGEGDDDADEDADI